MSKAPTGTGRMGLLAAALVITILLSVPIGSGFASSSYSSTTVNTGNSISANYFTVGLYTDSACTAACTDILRTDAEYQKVGDPVSGDVTYSIADDTELTHNGESIEQGNTTTSYQLYLKIGSVNLTGTYGVSVDCECGFIYNSSTTELANASIIATLTNLDDSSPAQISEGTYKLSLKTRGFSAVMDNDPTSLSITMSIVVTDNCSGTYVGSPETVAITSESSIIINNETEAAQAINDANKNNTTVDNFVPSSGGGSHASGKTYTGGWGVTVANGSDATISEQGKINASLNCVDTPFILVMYKGNRGGDSDGTLKITIDGKSTQFTINTNNRMYVVYADTNGLTYDGPSAVTNSFNATQYMSGKTWITGTSMTVEVTSGSVKDLTFDIVLKNT